MRRSPSMVPSEAGQDTYLVLDDLGRLGRVWRETAEDATHETLIRDLLEDQYGRPTRIVAFNTTEGWSRDVTLISPTSYADALPSTMTCRFLCWSYWRWQSAEALGNPQATGYFP